MIIMVKYFFWLGEFEYYVISLKFVYFNSIELVKEGGMIVINVFNKLIIVDEIVSVDIV